MDELKRLVELLGSALDELEKLRSAIDTFRQADIREPPQLRAAVKVLLERVEESHASLRPGLAESAEIGKRLDAQGGEPVAGVLATDLAKGFREVIQTIQREVDKDDDSDVGTIIRSMDVELKGLIVVENKEPKVVPPAPGQTIDPGQLSTIRMSFAAVPRERTVKREPGPG